MVIARILMIVLALILWSFIEKRLLRITEYQVPAKDSGNAPEDVNIVLLADLHNNAFGKKNSLLAKKIRELNPDLIIVAGDLITKKKMSIPGNAYDLLNDLVKDYPVFYGYGNHEKGLSEMPSEERRDKAAEMKRARYESFKEFRRVLEDKGVHFLVDESLSFKKDQSIIRISGLNAGWECYNSPKGFTVDSSYLEGHIGKADLREYQLLIAHDPSYFEAYANWGADLTLSGHLHGGLVRLPFLGGVVSPQYRFFPTYDSGLYVADNKRMIVSKGMGSHSFMMRLFNPPELVFIRISKKDT